MSDPLDEVEESENHTQKQEILPGYATMEDFTKEGFKILMEAIRNSNALPSGRDWTLQNTSESFSRLMNQEGNNILRMMNTILRAHDVDGNIRNKLVDEKVELVVEANDIILEKVANNIDELNGIKKNVIAPVQIQTVSAQLPLNGSWNRINSATFSVGSNLNPEKQSQSVNAIRLLTAKNIVRPQKFFKDKIDNSNHPWEPRITEKPNSLKPLAIFLEETENGEEFSHPYHFELERFIPSEEHLKQEEPVPPKPISETPLIEIAEPEQLNDLVEKLRNCKSFSVDLEHHSYRTFMGITCLMQISTRDCDYLIDTLALRDKLSILNEVFTKPSILKIFHGADMDIQWLQRDLSVYVVNMFDTHQAAKILEYPALSLSYLIKRFCDFVPNKQFQLADWRIRPLPDELKNYAREDTHYLEYIYQKLKEELLRKGNGADNFLKSVFQKSTEICKKRYTKPILKEDSHLEFYRKCKRLFDNRQLYALKALYNWRDQISRREDESTGYVLPNHMLLQISESLPREMQGILACCNPTPPLVKSNLLELHQMILKARDQPVEKAILKEDSRSRGSTVQFTKVNVDSPLHCPHDLSKSGEFRDDLPTLFNKKISNEDILLADIEKAESQYSVFNNSNGDQIVPDKATKTQIKLLTPYQRYKLAKTYIQAQSEKATKGSAEGGDKPNDEEGNKQDDDVNAASENAGEETMNESEKDKKNDSRTDEERIESIRNHFLSLSRMAADEKREVILSYEENDSPNLLQMGGTKKRKRDTSPEKDTCDDVEPDNNDEHLQTPRPSVFSRLSMKRTSSEAFGEDDFADNFHDNQGKFQMNFSQSNDGNKKKNRRRPRPHKKQNINQTRRNDQNQHEEEGTNIPGWRRPQQQKPNINRAQRDDQNEHNEADMNISRHKGRRPLKKRNINAAQRNDHNQDNEADMNISRRKGRRPLKKRNINTAQRNDQNQHEEEGANIPGWRRPQQQKPNINTPQRNDHNQHNEADMNIPRHKGRRPLKKRNINTAQRNYQNQYDEADTSIPRRRRPRPHHKQNINNLERSDQSQHNEAVRSNSNPEENRWQQDDSQPQPGNRPQQGKFRSRNRRPKSKKNKNNIPHMQISNDNYMPGSSSSSKQIKQDPSEASFEPYDYSSVDFKVFQGGAERAHKPQQIKSNFRGKGRRRRGNRGNKQSVFGNVKGNRKGR